MHAELFDGKIRSFRYGPRSRPPADPRRSWQRAARTVADANLDLVRRHPWLITRPNERPVLGPHSTAKYEAELAAFDRTGLSAAEVDLALWQVLNHVRGVAGDLLAGQSSPESTADWWQARYKFGLSRILDGLQVLIDRRG
ncbi:TetR/AcrR family transcriptional regulator C-terminal domain-containing protein [Microlunatus elymi]|uniref:TetR/AcrR family transcriptional regulator C-terminal domain-containing protein n=1 Tax=Microlunatus elymi TaxID=2596828 RepID=UPI00143D83A2|nr:TetR/AcrR family transcriptional regulator C-terminal domain-containing protein [Microlunatus elymi]